MRRKAFGLTFGALLGVSLLFLMGQVSGPTTRTPRLTIGNPTPATAYGDLRMSGNLNVAGTSTFTGASTFTAPIASASIDQLTIPNTGLIELLGSAKIVINSNQASRCSGCELDSEFVNQADETRTSTTTLADTSDFVLGGLQSANWELDAYLMFTSTSATPDVKIGWRSSIAPLAGSWIRCQSHETTTATQSTQSSQPAAAATALNFDLVTGGNVLLMHCKGILRFGATFDIALQFAQVTSNANATTFLAGSLLKIRLN